MRRLMVCAALLAMACDDGTPAKTGGSNDAGESRDATNIHDSGLDAGGNPNDGGQTLDPSFWVESASLRRVEQGERMRGQILLTNREYLDCGLGLPTVSWRNSDGDGVTVTADDCFELGFHFTATADMPVGSYDLSVQDGAGRPGDARGIELEVVEKRGRDQAPLLDGTQPDLAANPELRSSMIVGIAPGTGRVFVAPRTLDFVDWYDQPAPLDTGISANDIRVVSQDAQAGRVGFGLVWADAASVRVSWLGADGSVVDSTAPLAAVGAYQLDAVHDADDWAVAWRDATGAIWVAVTTVGATQWTAGPIEVGKGQWPSVTRDTFGFRVHWTNDELRDVAVGFEADGTVGGNLDEDPYGRAYCDYADQPSHRVCNVYNTTTGEYVHTSAHLQSRDFAMDLAVHPSAWPVPAEVLADARAGDPIFVAYPDSFGGTTYAYFQAANTNRADAVDQWIARHGQAGGPGAPRISVHTLRDEVFLAWVREVDGKIELGTIVY